VRYESWKNILYRVYITRDQDEASNYLVFQISPGLEGPADMVWQGKDHLLIRVNCGDINIPEQIRLHFHRAGGQPPLPEASRTHHEFISCSSTVSASRPTVSDAHGWWFLRVS